MVVQCQGSAEEVLARLDALSREWRDSQFPVEFNHALGRVPIRITRESAHRFRIVVGLASRTLHDIATDIEVIEDQFGTTMRFDPQLTPGFLGAWWRYAALLAVPMLLFGWREGWSLSRFYFIPFAALVLTTIGYVYATTVDDQIEVGVHKLLKRIAKPNDAPTTACRWSALTAVRRKRRRGRRFIFRSACGGPAATNYLNGRSTPSR